MENEEQVQAPIEAESPKQPELSISDLQNLKAIVETAVRRGAFQAAEMSPVGSVYDRLNNFLTAITPKQEEQTQSE